MEMSAPYDEYVDRTIAEISESFYTSDYYIGEELVKEDPCVDISVRGLKAMLADAWLAGLGYSLNLIEGEKERRG